MSLNRINNSRSSVNVFCICGGFGFPYGTASTNRIKNIGKCCVVEKIPFHVFHLGPSPFKENTENKGDYEYITFEYLSPSVKWPKNKIIRIFCYLYGYIKLISRLYKIPRNSIVYTYYQGDSKNFFVLLLCRLFRIPVVQEVCEWWSNTEHGSWFTTLMYNKIMFRMSDGALPISHEIYNRIRRLTNPEYPLLIVPVLVEPVSINDTKSQNTENNLSVSDNIFLWCGMADGYMSDLLFLIDSLAHMKSPATSDAVLRIVGPCSQEGRNELIAYAESKSIKSNQLDITGFVSDEQLWEYCKNACGLLMPLWKNDRSQTRFPTKFGLYILAGRPIITARIGEMNHYLTDSTAMFYIPGDSKSLANCLDILIEKPEFGDQLALKAQSEVLKLISVQANSAKVTQWFNSL